MQPTENQAEPIRAKTTAGSHGEPRNASSTGQEATDATWLAGHFESFRPEYERCVQMVDLEAGWHVLDAGCGSGSFLPLLAEAIGAEGRLSAIDLAPDNVEVVQRRLASWNLPCPVEIQQASILSLPFEDDSFDAVWIANVIMYLNDSELQQALSELRRVVCAGGLICFKEGDLRLPNFYPIPCSYYAPMVTAMGALFPGADHARMLPFHLRDCGIDVMKQQTVVIERWSPLSAADRAFYSSFLSTVAGAAAHVELPEAARAFWRAQQDPTSPESFVNQPDIAIVAGQIVVVGRVPGIEE